MSFTVPIPMTRVSSVSAAVRDIIAVSGEAESEMSTIKTWGAVDSERYSIT
jgi:hypothetical protein